MPGPALSISCGCHLPSSPTPTHRVDTPAVCATSEKVGRTGIEPSRLTPSHDEGSGYRRETAREGECLGHPCRYATRSYQESRSASADTCRAACEPRRLLRT